MFERESIMRITLPTVDTTAEREHVERSRVRKLSVVRNRSEIPALPLILIALTLAMLLLVPYLILLDRLQN